MHLLSDIQRHLACQKKALIERNPRIGSYFHPIAIQARDEVELLEFLPIRIFRKMFVWQHHASPRIGFKSSGSTQAVRAVHGMSEFGLTSYRSDCIQGWQKFCARFQIQKTSVLVNFVPTPLDWPESSLSFMMESILSIHTNSVTLNPELQFQQIYSFLMQSQGNEPKIIFGTTFHHMQWLKSFVASGAPKLSGKFYVVDTGGTKGKTQTISGSDLVEYLQKVCFEKCELLSEYGMCELSNQAWSSTMPHNGWFDCNDSLSVLAINYGLEHAIQHHLEGFLAFIDLGNKDSYSAILTEDLGQVDATGKRFLLCGRSPDASIKGCSLNVKGSFYRLGDSESGMRLAAEDPSCWTPKWKCDFDQIWLGLQAFDARESRLPSIDSNLGNVDFTGYTLNIIASANIPLTVLYPLYWAAKLGFHGASVCLPSFRAEDTVAQRVRAQIVQIVVQLMQWLRKSDRIVKQNLLANSKPAFDIHFVHEPDFSTKNCVHVLFGSDETVALAKAAQRNALSCSVKQTVLGFGDVFNIVRCASLDQALIADCSRFLGRGCLTPIAAIVADTSNLKDFFDSLCTEFKHRFDEIAIDPSCYHRHNRLELIALYGASQVHMGNGVTLVDLTARASFQLSDTEVIKQMGGAGTLFLLPTEFPFAHEFSMETSTPTPVDAHCGQTWQNWLIGAVS